MSASISVHITSGIREESHELSFYETQEWTTHAEQDLMIKLQEIISIARVCSKSMNVKIQLDVQDVDEALFVLRKKIHHTVEINHSKLSLREVEVLGLIMQGLTNIEIAEKLFISYETVKSHRKHILNKTGAKNTAALVNHYHQTFFEK